jgi:hypothetical protein
VGTPSLVSTREAEQLVEAVFTGLSIALEARKALVEAVADALDRAFGQGQEAQVLFDKLEKLRRK